MSNVKIIQPVPSSFANRVEDFLVRTGERLNPILVKETRQAVKGRLFSITFTLVLICGWVWSFWGVSQAGPGISHGAHGAEIFYIYSIILAVAVLIVVPFTAYRSLAAECEDRTYELLSITTLSPQQIVIGKLGSAVAQMLVYFSALAPCLAFTYLLRGIDILAIVTVLVYMGLISLGMSMFALLIATLSTERHWQVIWSVVLIIILLLVCWAVCAFVGAVVVFRERIYQEEDFGVINAAALTFFVTSFAIFFYAAVARLTFVSDNRATKLRIAMLVQSLAWLGWCSGGLVGVGRVEHELLGIFLSLAGGYWYFMGAIMTGESPDLSLRVRRNLPETDLGKFFLSWFFPGPGRGYVFALANLATAAMLTIAVVLVTANFAVGRGMRFVNGDGLCAFAVLLFSYVAIYLGVGLRILRAMRRRGSQVGLLMTLMVQFLLLTFGTLIPLLLSSLQRYNTQYSLLQITNPFWSTSAVLFDRGIGLADGNFVALITLVPLTALIVFALNVRDLTQEMHFVRTASPERITEDDALRSQPQRKKTSPWDDVES